MKVDYAYIKQILSTLRDNESYRTDNYDLAKICGVDVQHINEASLDKFVGHVKLLQDNFCIDCPAENLGFVQNLNKHWITNRVSYRLTNRGYEFLEILNEKTVFNKVKNFSLSMALEVGKSLVIAALTKGISK
jgi:hypothetical protein